jgi:RNA 3'-terminal phosphate cyclase (ATP)
MMAPPADFLQKAFLPLVARMGPAVTLTLDRYGFYPAGDWAIEVVVEPVESLRPIELVERGRVERRSIVALVANLPLSIARREADTIRRQLGWPEGTAEAREVEATGPGNVVWVEVGSRHVTEVFTGFGQKGVPAEKIAQGVGREVRRYLEADVPVGEHLADQLLLPLALAGGGRFRTLEPTGHTTTNIATIGRFLDVPIRLEPGGPGVAEIAAG